MIHAPYCQEYNDKIAAEQLAFEKAWPDYCRECGATGEQCYPYDPSPAGVALSPGSIEECDPCEGTQDRPCVYQGYCPRCGKLNVDSTTGKGVEDLETCVFCTWAYRESPSAPPPRECTCYDDAKFHGYDDNDIPF